MNWSEVVTLVACALTMVGAAFTLFKNNSISNKTVDRTADAESRLSTEHKMLSTEIKTLNSNQIVLTERTSDTKAGMNEIRKSVQEMNHTLIQSDTDRKLQFATLSDAQKNLVQSADNIGKFAGEFQRLATELVKTKSELQQQLSVNQHLKLTIQKLNVRIDNLERSEQQRQFDRDDEWER